MWETLYVNPYVKRKRVEEAEKWRRMTLRRRRLAAQKREMQEKREEEERTRRNAVYGPTVVGVYRGAVPCRTQSEVLDIANRFMREWRALGDGPRMSIAEDGGYFSNEEDNNNVERRRDNEGPRGFFF